MSSSSSAGRSEKVAGPLRVASFCCLLMRRLVARSVFFDRLGRATVVSTRGSLSSMALIRLLSFFDPVVII